MRSALTESDSSLLLELLLPDADAPPAEALVSLLEADVEVAAVVDVSSVLVALVEAVAVLDSGWAIETEVMLTMGVIQSSSKSPPSSTRRAST